MVLGIDIFLAASTDEGRDGASDATEQPRELTRRRVAQVALDFQVNVSPATGGCGSDGGVGHARCTIRRAVSRIRR